MAVEVTEVARSDREILRQIFEMRAMVWAALGVASSWEDLHDDHARHFVVLADGRVVGAARFCFHDSLASVPDADVYGGVSICGHVAALNRMVVAPSARGAGIASALDDRRLREIDAAKCKHTIANVLKVTGLARVQNLEKRGFVRLCDDFERDLDVRGKCLALHRTTSVLAAGWWGLVCSSEWRRWYPFAFHAGPIGNATLLVASDDLLGYGKQQDIADIAWGPDLAIAARSLVDLVRLPSGALQDDVAVVLGRALG